MPMVQHKIRFLINGIGEYKFILPMVKDDIEEQLTGKLLKNDKNR
jgi:hypothetical protein